MSATSAPVAATGWSGVRKPRLLFVSSRPAQDTTSGQLLMHRHLSAVASRFEIHRAHVEAPDKNDQNYTELTLSPCYRQLCRTRWFTRWANAIDLTIGFAVSLAQLHSLIKRIRPDIVLTVAEPPVFRAVSAVAKTLRLPLVTVVHDWAPVWVDLPGKLRTVADQRFHCDCKRSTFTLNVSQEFAERFGGGWRHRVLLPIPGESRPASHGPTAPFHALYAGVFHYQQRTEMAGLCAELLRRDQPTLLRVIGRPPPDWNSADMAPVRAGGFYAGFHKNAALDHAFASASALLVICPFAENLKLFSHYSFPSKLTEYARHKRPLLLWAPPYAAAVKWALQHNAALVVTDPDPRAVADALLNLEADDDLRAQLVASIETAAKEFSPNILNARFEETLWDALREHTGTAC